ncbi:MAG: hypothetical protein Q8N57_00260 [bacterium]|nr:hypothetical protein [bacterium]
MDARKRNRLIFLVVIAVICLAAIIGAILLNSYLKNRGQRVKVNSGYLANLEKDLKAMKVCCEKVGSLEKELTSTQTALKMSIEQTKISNQQAMILQYELEKCLGVKKVVKNTTSTAKKLLPPPPPPPKPRVVAVSPDLVQKEAFKPPTEKPKMESAYKTALDGTKFIGLKDGDFYITISDGGYLQYVFAKRLYDEAAGKGTPELNSKGSGKLFELDGDFYIYIDKTAPATGVALTHTYLWAVYIGDRDGYSAYLPNELIKPDIIRARGELAGTISPEDVLKIGESVSEVQNGRIKPNKITAIGDYDGLKYEGWHFCTPVMYKTVQ